MALAMCVQLSGQSLKEYGFELIATQPALRFSPHYCGFSEPTHRDAALKKWKEWAAAQKAPTSSK